MQISISDAMQQMIGTAELARMLDMHPGTITNAWIERNHFPRPVKLNTRNRKWSLAEVTQWLDKQRDGTV